MLTVFDAFTYVFLMQSTRNMSAGGPLVSHASKLYTFKVFDMFCKIKIESDDYFVLESDGGTNFMVQHYNLDKVECWCKGKYVVTVDVERSMFICQCGMFEHFGLPCCHALRVCSMWFFVLLLWWSIVLVHESLLFV